MNYDVIIIGAGPAGLSAAVYAARGELKTAVFDKGIEGGQMNLTDEIENYPGFENVVTGYEMGMKMKAQAEKFGAEFKYEEITAVSLDGYCKIVETANATYCARALIIATGASPRRLNIPGEARLTGRGVSYCAVCDGALYRDKVVAVIGGGDSAVEEAMFLTKFAKKVYLIHRRSELRAEKVIQNRAFANDKIEFIWDTVPNEIEGDPTVQNLKLFNRKENRAFELPVQGVFIYVGILPNNNLFESRLDLDEAGFVKTNELMQTKLPGVYVAGDLRHKPLRQVVTAAADGGIAGWSAEKWIEENDEHFPKGTCDIMKKHMR
ncbi:MAG: thioredoxin-disulfide reductase [Candidatus Cloacimonetes bacterium]|nr:thioredoxin-disulfide reductase [Candidatus Cloacimonadota bacterium]